MSFSAFIKCIWPFCLPYSIFNLKPNFLLYLRYYLTNYLVKSIENFSNLIKIVLQNINFKTYICTCFLWLHWETFGLSRKSIHWNINLQRNTIFVNRFNTIAVNTGSTRCGFQFDRATGVETRAQPGLHLHVWYDSYNGNVLNLYFSWLTIILQCQGQHGMAQLEVHIVRWDFTTINMYSNMILHNVLHI